MATLIDSYSELNHDGSALSITTTTWRSQSFTGDGSVLGSVEAYMRWAISQPTSGTVTALIYAHSGTFGTSSVPTGSALATSDTVDATTIGSSYSLVEFIFSGAEQITLENGTKYCLVLTRQELTGIVYWGLDSSSPTHAGNLATSSNSGSSWSATSTQDFCFYVYSSDTPPPPEDSNSGYLFLYGAGV